MKWKSVIPALVITIGLLGTTLGFTPSASAEESGTTTIKLDVISVEVPYTEPSYSFNRIETPTEVKVEVLNEVKEVVDAYGEIKELSSSNSKPTLFAAAANRTVLAYRELVTNGFVANRLYSSLVVRTIPGSSFAQIQSVNETYWTPSNSDGTWTLEERHAYTTPVTGSYPTWQVSVTGTAVVDTVRTEYGGVQLGKIGWSQTSDGHYRKLIELTFSYSTL
ncbi:hypothetical protein [Paenibacillus sp. NPDC057934]|uniref:hypothetical protein n=1 Tax=Paenibacillus sp. NPDC057934 TaxID=3346282 RepID=UPI0036DD2E7A